MSSHYQRLTNTCLVLVGLLLISGAIGCAPQEQVTEVAEAQIEEIPITTDSDAAMALYEEGEYLLDVGRGVEAREKFMAAIGEDPGFVRAHFNQSNAALSFKASHFRYASMCDPLLAGNASSVAPTWAGSSSSARQARVISATCSAVGISPVSNR